MQEPITAAYDPLDGQLRLLAELTQGLADLLARRLLDTADAAAPNAMTGRRMALVRHPPRRLCVAHSAATVRS
jgi:hypothetical protein